MATRKFVVSSLMDNFEATELWRRQLRDTGHVATDKSELVCRTVLR